MVLPSCEKLPKTEAEVGRFTADNVDWAELTERCPAEFMTAQTPATDFAELDCKGERLSTCYRGCKRGEKASCYWLAYTLQQKSMDDPAAQVLYQRACQLGEPSGCVNRAAGAMARKPADPQTLQCSARTFERGCELEDIWGCSMSGMVYWRGMGVPADSRRAARAFERACALPGSANHEACKSARAMLQLMNQQHEPAAAAEPPAR